MNDEGATRPTDADPQRPAASALGAVDDVLVPGSRLNLLASAVRNGRYHVDPLAVADAMLPFVYAMR